VKTGAGPLGCLALAAILLQSGCALEPQGGGGERCAAPDEPMAARLLETIRSGFPPSVAGSPPAEFFSLIAPEQIALTASDLFIADRGRGALVRMQRAQRSIGTMASLRSRVSGMHVDRFGSLYLALPAERKVVQGSTQGGVQRDFAGPASVSLPVDVTSDGVSRVFVADAAAARVVVFDRLGQVVGTVGERAAMPNPFQSVSALAHGELGLYVLDAAARRVHLIAQGGADRVWDIGQVARLPVALAADRFGRVFIADRGASRILVLGNFAGAQELKDVPPVQDLSDLWVDDFGVLYASDAAGGAVYALQIPEPCP
jgi:hypothetical protein